MVEILKNQRNLNLGRIFLKAAENGRVCVLCYLINKNIDINIKDDNGQHALHLSAGKGFPLTTIALLHWLLDYDNNKEKSLEIINAKDRDGMTPLHLSAFNSSYDTIRFLIYMGADKHQLNNDNEMPYDIAKRNSGNEKILKILKPNSVCCRRKNYKNRSNAKFWINIAFLLFRYFYFIFDILNEFAYQYVAVSYTLSISVICLLMIVSFKNPGYIQKPKENDDLFIIYRRHDQDACLKCATVQNRLHDVIYHCWKCRKCVERYDHHCDWIANCVGKNNFLWFIWYLLALALELLFHLLLLILLPLKLNNSGVDFIPSQVRYKKGINGIIWIALAALMLLVLLWTLWILTFQFYSLCTSTTNFQRNKLNSRPPINIVNLMIKEEYRDTLRTTTEVGSRSSCFSNEEIHQ